MKNRGKWIAAAALLGILFVVALVACSGNDASVPSGNSMGAAGGTVSIGSVELQVPAGAAPAGTAITLTESTTPPPAAYSPVTPLYVFAPDGLVFAKPVTVKIAFQGSSAGLRVYWSKQNDPGSYEPLVTQIENGVAIAQVTHFSTGFLGYGPSVATVAPVAFTPSAGTYASPVSVAMTTATAGATIYFTVDGTEPTTSSSVYSTPILISSTTTVKAMAAHAGDKNSIVTSASYEIDAAVAPVTFDPPSGSFPDLGVAVALATGTAGATIYYTTDGSEPTTASAVYAPGSSVIIATTSTVKAIATKAGLANSAVTSAAYTIAPPRLEPVSFNPSSGLYNDQLSVSLAAPTAGATIYYTVDGSDPTTSSAVYTQPIVVSKSLTLKAVAKRDGALDSPVRTAMYTLAVAPVTFSPSAGAFTTPQSVTLATATPGATIYYTLDGTDPTTASIVYSTPISIATTTTVRAMARRQGFDGSAISEGVFTIAPPPQEASPVTFNPPGGTYANAVAVGLSSATAGATIYYTLDGSMPTATPANMYSSGSPIPIGAATTIKAMATHVGYGNSSVTNATFTFKVAPVELSPTAGAITMPADISLTTQTSQSGIAVVNIYYTLDGSTPTTASTLYTGPIHLVATATIKAFATKSGYADADLTTGTYTAQ